MVFWGTEEVSHTSDTSWSVFPRNQNPPVISSVPGSAGPYSLHTENSADILFKFILISSWSFNKPYDIIFI